jgi:hypothetical protein
MTVLWVELEKIMYGAVTSKAADWCSLGPIKWLGIVYKKMIC